MRSEGSRGQTMWGLVSMVGSFALYSWGIEKPLDRFELTCVFNQSPWLVAMCRADCATMERKSGVVSYTLCSSARRKGGGLDEDNGSKWPGQKNCQWNLDK